VTRLASEKRREKEIHAPNAVGTDRAGLRHETVVRTDPRPSLSRHTAAPLGERINIRYGVDEDGLAVPEYAARNLQANASPATQCFLSSTSIGPLDPNFTARAVRGSDADGYYKVHHGQAGAYH